MIKLLHEITGDEAGGKAKGLKSLREMGLLVPEAVVLIQPKVETLDDGLLQKHLVHLGSGPKAVRSSAVSEDGTDASFAGQFDTFLNLSTFDEIKKAIVDCINGAQADSVKEYAYNLIKDADLRISVVLQNMVDARVAGVVFSANPVNNRRDKVLINAVEGIGEALVSGVKDAVQYELYRSGSNIADQIKKQGELLSDEHLKEILEGAKKAEQFHGAPVDMEWAVDGNNTLHWLQVRPITTLSEVHYNELDTVQEDSSDVWTLGNIGEMMPGVATPLTYSVCAEAIDYGMTWLAEKGGAYKLSNRKGKRYIQMFYNRLFINMSNMMDYPKNIWMNKASDVQFALSGKVFPGLTAKPEVILPRRVINFFKQMITTSRAQKHLEDLRRLDAGFTISSEGSLDDLHARLGEARHQLGLGFGHHLMTSAQSGSLYSAFMRIMTGNDRWPGAEEHHIATMLLLDIPDIESADAIKSLERFANQITKEKEVAAKFVNSTPEEALRLLREEAPTAILQEFATFLERHGHRCVRESELREKPWAENPLQLIHALQTRVRIGESKHVHRSARKEINDTLGHLPFVKRTILHSLITVARKAVARREITKALSIKMVSKIRTAYQVLANKLVEEGLLEDTDQVFFLTHEELGVLISDKQSRWKIVANMRRKQLPETDALVFDEVCFGKPEPLESEVEIDPEEDQLIGLPVSRGIVCAKVRIVHSLAQADQLQEGEIMVASFTDIGWTPYFSIISGLITEIGSPLSHGAVVAREYGIPAIVGAKGAKKFLKNGEMVLLDADRGIVKREEI
jgi:phosphohistidine swiveling domain-containing protein